MLKKQTVWLLTMLSLMIVLSVYYLTSPDSGDLAYGVNDGQDESEETAANDAAETENGASVDEIANASEDQFFTTVRMELQDKRSEAKERLNEVVASSTASTEEKNKAYDDIAAIESRSTKETILEKSILDSSEYQDVLVRWEDGKVFVHVKADELSKTAANNIMQLVRDEFGDIRVNVDFQHPES
ncbi:SpoIIIAH-like family protein [Virgibacillus oceani]|uniref:Stage III sporulation protein AH n=1 Tax=Virgibacillus oceani TaxID=1479511 RepID=A0A917H0V6_9BACI|nr:SpoIIIAH-like family protein [Virgibacillus oceani]GGG63937.1 stage III sporulation protein AH [Virgibacillus oceani]